MVSLNFTAVISIYHNIFLDLTQTQLLISSYMHAKLSTNIFYWVGQKVHLGFQKPE